MLDPDERHVGKQILADEFFKRHQGHAYMFGPSYGDGSHKQNVQKLVNSYRFVQLLIHFALCINGYIVGVVV